MLKWLFTLAMVMSSTLTHATELLPEQIAQGTIERRAVEAVIWGMPAVNTDLMLQEMLDKTAAKVGQVVYWGRPLDWRNQTLTPNPDALYFMAFFDTKEGPVVLDLPPSDAEGSFNANIVTMWQMPLEDAGLLGADKGAGGKYVVCHRAGKEPCRRALRHCSRIPSAAICCSAQTSPVIRTLMSQRLLLMGSAWRCIRFPRPPTRKQQSLRMQRTSSLIVPSTTMRVFSNILIGSSRVSHGCNVIAL